MVLDSSVISTRSAAQARVRGTHGWCLGAGRQPVLHPCYFGGKAVHTHREPNQPNQVGVAGSLLDGGVDLGQFDPGNTIAEAKRGYSTFCKRYEKTVRLFRQTSARLCTSLLTLSVTEECSSPKTICTYTSPLLNGASATSNICMETAAHRHHFPRVPHPAGIGIALVLT